MEAHISNKIESKFLSIQPILFEDGLLDKFLRNDFSLKKLDIFVTKDEPSWFKEFEKINNIYNSLNILEKKNEVDILHLKDDCKDIFINGINLGEVINFDKSDYYLLCDYKINYYVLFLDIHIECDHETYEHLIKIEDDLYNTIRNLLVREDGSSVIGNWASNIYKNSLSQIEYYCNDILNIDVDKKEISVQNNSGNITNFVLYNDCDFATLQSQLLLRNNISERLQNDNEEYIKLDSCSAYIFRGRFHTIISNRDSDMDRYVPIQFHMQYMWFYLKMINSYMDRLNLEVIDDRSMNNIDSYLKVFEKLINKIEMLSIYNERFKVAIENDYNIIYKNIEERWSVERLLSNSKKFVTFFKEYIDREYIKKTSLIEGKQNNILFFISVLQLIALIGVWNDYNSLLNEDNIHKDSIILDFFGSWENLELFNSILPLSFIAIIVFMIIYIFKKR